MSVDASNRLPLAGSSRQAPALQPLAQPLISDRDVLADAGRHRFRIGVAGVTVRVVQPHQAPVGLLHVLHRSAVRKLQASVPSTDLGRFGVGEKGNPRPHLGLTLRHDPLNTVSDALKAAVALEVDDPLLKVVEAAPDAPSYTG